MKLGYILVLFSFLFVQHSFAQSNNSDLKNSKEELYLMPSHNADFDEFKSRIFDLVSKFDRKNIKQSDIEKIMGQSFINDPKAESFEIEASANKMVAPNFKSLGVQQYILTLKDVFKETNIPPSISKDSLLYGFENNKFDFPKEIGKCLSIKELKSHLPADTKYSFTQLGMFYMGLDMVKKGATISAFVYRDSVKFDEGVEKQLAKFDAMPDAYDNPKIIKQIEELKKQIDGCITILDIM